MKVKSRVMVDFLNEASEGLFDRSREDCIGRRICVLCGDSAEYFRDDGCRKEFGISGMCQVCQDRVFGGD